MKMCPAFAGPAGVLISEQMPSDRIKLLPKTEDEAALGRIMTQNEYGGYSSEKKNRLCGSRRDSGSLCMSGPDQVRFGLQDFAFSGPLISFKA